MLIHPRRSRTPDSYGAGSAARKLPQYSMQEQGLPPDVAYNLVRDELMLDGNTRQNLATFCQTWMGPNIHAIMDECVDKNMIDKGEYPATAELENRCVHMLAELWNSPESKDTAGCSTTGSSEAAMLGACDKVPLAQQTQAGRQGRVQTEYRDRPRAGLLAQVRPVF